MVLWAFGHAEWHCLLETRVRGAVIEQEQFPWWVERRLYEMSLYIYV
jgi:hypothetical protein